MSDEENNNETPEEAEEVSLEPAAAAERTFTQTEVNAFLAKEAAKLKRKLTRDMNAKMAEQQKQQEPTASTEQGNEALEQLQKQVAEVQAALAAKETEASYQSATAGMDLSEHDATLLRALHKADPQVFAAEVERRKAADKPPDPKGPGFSGTGASPNPHADPSKKPLSEWTKDDVATMRANGTFLQRAKEYRDSLPGGSGGLFPAKNPKKAG